MSGTKASDKTVRVVMGDVVRWSELRRRLEELLLWHFLVMLAGEGLKEAPGVSAGALDLSAAKLRTSGAWAEHRPALGYEVRMHSMRFRVARKWIVLML